MTTPLELAQAFVRAVEARDAEAAAALCADEIEVMLPGAEAPLRGREGVRQMIRMSPSFVQSPRSEAAQGLEAQVTTLIRFPGAWANYTTWRFETDGERIRRLTFALRAAN